MYSRPLPFSPEVAMVSHDDDYLDDGVVVDYDDDETNAENNSDGF